MKVLNIKSKESKVLKAIKKVLNGTGRKIMSVDSFDGHKRGEVIARRVIMLLALILAIYVLLDLLVDRGYLKTNEPGQVHSVSQIVVQTPVIALELTEESKMDNDTPEVKQVPQIAPQDLVGDVEKYVAHLFLVDYNTLRTVCKPCHKIENQRQKKGITFEEAAIEKEVINIVKTESVQDIIDFIECWNFNENFLTNNATNRRIALTEIYTLIFKGE